MWRSNDPLTEALPEVETNFFREVEVGQGPLLVGQGRYIIYDRLIARHLHWTKSIMRLSKK